MKLAVIIAAMCRQQVAMLVADPLAKGANIAKGSHVMGASVIMNPFYLKGS